MKDEPMWHLTWPDGDPRNDNGQQDFQTAIDLAAWMRRNCDAGDVVNVWHSYEL